MVESTAPTVDERTTAPQSPYTLRQVGIGAFICLIGLVLIALLTILV